MTDFAATALSVAMASRWTSSGTVFATRMSFWPPSCSTIVPVDLFGVAHQSEPEPLLRGGSCRIVSQTARGATPRHHEPNQRVLGDRGQERKDAGEQGRGVEEHQPAR